MRRLNAILILVSPAMSRRWELVDWGVACCEEEAVLQPSTFRLVHEQSL